MSKKIEKKGENILKSERINRIKKEMNKIAKKVSVEDIFGLNYFYFKMIASKF